MVSSNLNGWAARYAHPVNPYRSTPKIKIPCDFFEYDCIKEIESDPIGDSILCLWLKIMCYAIKEGSKKTKIIFDFPVELTDEIVANVFLRSKYSHREQISYMLEKLEDLGMIKRYEKEIRIIPFWLDKRDRNSPEYIEWRKTVFERDGYACANCGSKNKLQAHHIISWKSTKNNPALRFDPDNGITLCSECHLKEHGGCWRNG